MEDRKRKNNGKTMEGKSKGVYALVIANSRDISIEIGHARRVMEFRRGYYAYIGSALSGLDRRIERHMRDDKKLHWHIDFMLAAQPVRIVMVFVGRTEERKECEIAAHMSAVMEPVKGFGCSDCSCISHLFFSPHLNTLISAVRSSFLAAGVDVSPFSHHSQRTT
ncbi:MAG: GIY-YIG nuclease family protein [Canidatus Methanoxibalbensis ujae]|nr:GIY-YIG nuclease family protein [Candidatus Methanoxibalbensis ujae]